LTTFGCIDWLQNHKPIKVAIYYAVNPEPSTRGGVDMADLEITASQRLDTDTSGLWPQLSSSDFF
jgi:hypothetical protein